MKSFKFKINDNAYNVDINEVEGQEIKLAVNGTSYTVTVDQEMRPRPTTTIISSRPAPRVSTGGMQQSAPVAAPSAAKSSSAVAGNKVSTPLPGTILDVFVNVGDAVKAGQRVVLLEAMKMENNIEADCDGTVKSVNVRKGDNVLEGDTLIVIG